MTNTQAVVRYNEAEEVLADVANGHLSVEDASSDLYDYQQKLVAQYRELEDMAIVKNEADAKQLREDEAKTLFNIRFMQQQIIALELEVNNKVVSYI